MLIALIKSIYGLWLQINNANKVMLVMYHGVVELIELGIIVDNLKMSVFIAFEVIFSDNFILLQNMHNYTNFITLILLWL
jgi:hypothetical protein